MFKISKAEQSAWAGDIAAIAVDWYANIYSASSAHAPDPTNIMLVFNHVGKLIAWSATFPGKLTIAKLAHWTEAETMIKDDFANVEHYIQHQPKGVVRYYMELDKDGATYRPFTIER